MPTLITIGDDGSLDISTDRKINISSASSVGVAPKPEIYKPVDEMQIVKDFQRCNNLGVDGIVGYDTFAALASAVQRHRGGHQVMAEDRAMIAHFFPYIATH